MALYSYCGPGALDDCISNFSFNVLGHSINLARNVAMHLTAYQHPTIVELHIDILCFGDWIPFKSWNWNIFEQPFQFWFLLLLSWCLRLYGRSILKLQTNVTSLNRYFTFVLCGVSLSFPLKETWHRSIHFMGSNNQTY